MHTYSFRIPTGETLTFSKVAKTDVLIAVQQGQFLPIETQLPRQLQELVLISKSQEVIYLYEMMPYGHLFKSLNDLKKSVAGEGYSNSIISYDRHGNIRCAFELDFDSALSITDNYSFIDSNYPLHDNYLTYRYDNGQVCYLAFYNNKIQRQGYWFSCIDDFDYFYYNVFNN